MTGFADAIDRAARSWQRLANEDMSTFERAVAIINAVGDSIKGFNGWEAYMTLKKSLHVNKLIQAREW